MGGPPRGEGAGGLVLFPGLWGEDLGIGWKEIGSSRGYAMPASATVTSLPLETQQAADIVERFLEASMVPDPATAARYISPDLKITFTGGRKNGHPRATAPLNPPRHKWGKKKIGSPPVGPRPGRTIPYT